MEKPENLYTWPMDMNWVGRDCWRGRGDTGQKRAKGEKMGQL